jgi:ABC-type Fe3+-siderophore transport system permease subunit
MESTVTRPAVDVAPTGARARPGLALVLALLSVPGSTIAWELPLGGLWIGLPLAVAAIVLGIAAHRRLAGSRMALVAVAIGALAIAQMIVYTIVSALS